MSNTAKGKNYFKEIRKQVTKGSTTPTNDQNLPINPIYKPSFKGIKKKDSPLIKKSFITNAHQQKQFQSPMPMTRMTRVESCRDNILRSGNKDCNKFTNLLESLGHNSNIGGNSNKKSTEMSFGQILKKTPKNSNSNNAQIEQRCRQIKQKQYFSSRDNRNELSSLSKLKNKLISPLKIKKESKPQPKVENKVAQFDHESILSEQDLVNTSKAQSIAFDMSPCL